MSTKPGAIPAWLGLPVLAVAFLMVPPFFWQFLLAVVSCIFIFSSLKGLRQTAAYLRQASQARDGILFLCASALAGVSVVAGVHVVMLFIIMAIAAVLGHRLSIFKEIRAYSPGLFTVIEIVAFAIFFVVRVFIVQMKAYQLEDQAINFFTLAPFAILAVLFGWSAAITADGEKLAKEIDGQIQDKLTANGIAPTPANVQEYRKADAERIDQIEQQFAAREGIDVAIIKNGSQGMPVTWLFAIGVVGAMLASGALIINAGALFAYAVVATVNKRPIQQHNFIRGMRRAEK
ncbi:hypothetical protein ACIPLR_25590 [Herbaspirillum huttiense]|uniref:hypothetical protein n=1 Tax=Herbaspirillum huttiense TaxID=863372 RepID=UPI003829900A